MKLNDKNRIEFLHSMEHFMSSLVEKKEFTEALEYFDSNRNALLSFGDAAGKMFYLASKTLHSLSDLPHALKIARTAQNMASSNGDNILLADIFMTLGAILKKMNELKEAEKAYRDAESIFRRFDSLEGQSRALNMLAGLFFKQNDYKNSLDSLLDALTIARKLDDKKKIAFMLGNIGRVYTFTGNFSEAEKHLKMNIDLSIELGDKLETARAYLSLGYIYLQKGEYQNASDNFELALPLIREAKSSYDEAIYFTYVGELQYRTRQFENSEDSLNRALAIGEETASDSVLTGCTMRHLAELNLLTEDYRSALRFASKAQVIMEKADDKVEIGALVKIKAIIAEKNERPTAKKLYIKAIDLLTESNVRFEQADALIAAGKSELFTLRQKLTYLFRAEEFYNRHHLTMKLNQVEKIITELDRPTPESLKPEPTRAGSCPKAVDFITTDPNIEQFKCQVPLMAHTNLPLLLTGETGVGKDHMARYFHQMVRPGTPFVAINCASVPETLLESELFGYKKGAFTGADKEKPGHFVTANGGVLFLDEIGDMPLQLQTKLLGVLESRQVTPLGGLKPIPFDVKLVAATNANLEEMVERGEFRRDLYYRLSGLSFNIQPLRKRKQDIPLQLEHFLRHFKLLKDSESIPAEMVKQYVDYDWPGNTRELYNKILKLQVMTMLAAEGDLVELSRSVFEEKKEISRGSLFEKVEEFERKLLVEALLAAGGNKSEAARILGIHEATVRTKLKRYDIDLDNRMVS